jgi:trehalose-6-phosphatase
MGMDDPSQVKSTRRMTKILNKLTANPELSIMGGQFIERCSRDLDLDAIQQTTPIV